MPWLFAVDERTCEIDISPRLTFDHPLGVLTAALQGAGIARLLDFTVADDMRQGRLTEVLTAYRPDPLQVFAVYPSTRQVASRVRAFLDFLIEQNNDASAKVLP